MPVVLAQRTVQASGNSVTCEIIATGNGPALKVLDCPLVPLSLAETHKLLYRFARATPGDGEGLTPAGERLAAVLGELV